MRKIKRWFRVGLSVSLASLALFMLNSAFGRYKVVSSEQRFEEALDNSFVVAFIYPGKVSKEVFQKAERKAFYRKLKNAKRMFKMISSSYPYDYAQVLFITVNASKERIGGALSSYNIPLPTPDQPIFALFRGGKLVAVKKGFLIRRQVKEFIDSHLKSDIAEATKQRDVEEQRRLKAAKRRAYDRAYRWGPYWYGVGWPYYSWGYYGWPYYGYSWGWPYRGSWRGHRYRRRGGCRRCR